MTDHSRIRGFHRGYLNPRLKKAISPLPSNEAPKSESQWLRFVQIAAHGATVAAVVISLVGLYVAWRAIDFQRLEKDLADTRHSQEAAARNAQYQGLRARQLELQNASASLRLADLESRERITASELLLADAELLRRTQDVVEARRALNRTMALTSATEEARQSAVRNLVRAELSAFVTAHLNRVRELAIRERRQIVMLADSADEHFPLNRLEFEVFANRSNRAGSQRCRLSERYLMSSLMDEVDLDPIEGRVFDALCRYLTTSTGFQNISDFLRGDSSVRPMIMWELIGNDGPFSIEIRRGSRDFEADLVGHFWTDLDAGAVLMVPGARQLLMGPDRSAAGNEISELRGQLDRFIEGWPEFIRSLPPARLGQQIFTLRDAAEPGPLGSVPRISLASLNDGSAYYTQGFERNLLCTAAWYAQRAGLIESFARGLYCSPF